MFPLDLGDRLLWPDGVSTVPPEKVPEFLLRRVPLDKLAVTELSPDVVKFNEFSEIKLSVRTEVDLSRFPPVWLLPESINRLNLDDYLIGLADKIERDGLYDQRVERLSHEIWLFKELKLDDVLRGLIYVVDTMREKNAIWGVGRGSSCSSYLLFLMGLHEVDPVKYGIEVTDFIRTQET